MVVHKYLLICLYILGLICLPTEKWTSLLIAFFSLLLLNTFTVPSVYIPFVTLNFNPASVSDIKRLKKKKKNKPHQKKQSVVSQCFLSAE